MGKSGFADLKRPAKGQGIVEYAGAMVIAAAIVTALLAYYPDAFATTFQGLVVEISSWIVD